MIEICTSGTLSPSSRWCGVIHFLRCGMAEVPDMCCHDMSTALRLEDTKLFTCLEHAPSHCWDQPYPYGGTWHTLRYTAWRRCCATSIYDRIHMPPDNNARKPCKKGNLKRTVKKSISVRLWSNTNEWIAHTFFRTVWSALRSLSLWVHSSALWRKRVHPWFAFTGWL